MRSTRLLLLLCCLSAANAQTDATPLHKLRPVRADLPLYNANVIFLDPAHGGSDDGAKLGEDSVEKDATLAFAQRLKALLEAHSFTVITTRDAAQDNAAAPTLDQRVEAANRSHAVACILLHAANGGHGIHIYTSALPSSPFTTIDSDPTKPIQPWDTAQAASLADSQRLASDLATAINGIRVPLIVGHVSVKPIDSMTCPAVAVELAPLSTDSGQTSPADSAYQDRIAQALAAALNSWRGHAEPQLPPIAPKPVAPVPKSRVKAIPEEVPEIVTPPAHKPAPIIRKQPDTVPPGGNAR